MVCELDEVPLNGRARLEVCMGVCGPRAGRTFGYAVMRLRGPEVALTLPKVLLPRAVAGGGGVEALVASPGACPGLEARELWRCLCRIPQWARSLATFGISRRHSETQGHCTEPRGSRVRCDNRIAPRPRRGLEWQVDAIPARRW